VGDRLRWGILGNATIARRCVIPAIGASSNGEAVALGSRSPDTARDVVEASAIPRLYPSYDAVLADPDVDAVYIPLPNHLHRPWTLKALAAGKHVLCEKPLACSAAEAAEMGAAADRHGRLLMEAFMYRFHPRSRRVRDLVTSGAIGRPRLVHTAFCFAMDAQVVAAGTAPRLRPEMGGGALLDLGCYGVSVARWLLGAEPTAVQAMALYHPGGADLATIATLRFGDNALATVEASFVAGLRQTYSVTGGRGSVDLPHDAFIPWEKDAELTVRGPDDERGTREVVPGVDEYRLMVEHFADAAAGRAPLAYPWEESLANIRVLDAIAHAARSGAVVRLPGSGGT
jgi:predicted dehydrogenase